MRGRAAWLLVAVGLVLPGCASVPGSICVGVCVQANVDNSQHKQEAPPPRAGLLETLAAAVLGSGK